jgi:hypothetical protein
MVISEKLVIDLLTVDFRDNLARRWNRVDHVPSVLIDMKEGVAKLLWAVKDKEAPMQVLPVSFRGIDYAYQWLDRVEQTLSRRGIDPYGITDFSTIRIM